MLELFLSAMAIYIIYYIATIRKYDGHGNLKLKKNGKLKKKKDNDIQYNNYMAMPVEAKFFIKKYNVDLSKINNKGLLKVTALILGLNIAIITLIVGAFIKKDIIIQILISSVLLIPCYLLSLMLLSKYLKKKGLIKDEGTKESKKNRK